MARYRFGELFLCFVEIAIKELLAIGVSQEQAEQAAESVAKQVAKTFGGETVYVPILNTDINARNKKIIQEFNGHNHLDLAKKYCLSTIHIYRIIKENREHSSR